MAKTNRVEIRISSVVKDGILKARFDFECWNNKSRRTEYTEHHPADGVPDVFDQISNEYRQKGYHIVLVKYEPFSSRVRQMCGYPPLPKTSKE